MAGEIKDHGEARVKMRDLLEEMIQRNASDLHLVAGERPKYRIHGELVSASTEHVLQPKDTMELAYSILTDGQKKRFETEYVLDFSFGVAALSRFRGNVYRQRGSVAIAIRVVPIRIRTLEELKLSPALGELAEKTDGLVLVTGPTGSGKSTTLAAMIDKINRERRGHILCVEDPIEFIHHHKNCIVTQREVGADTPSFAPALKYALREDPDIVMIGEMRDLETIQAALTLAETGHLTLGTLHSRSSGETIHRIVDVFPSHQQPQVRAQLSSVLQGVVTQLILPRANQPGLVVAMEIMIATPAIRACIRDDKVHQIPSFLQAGKQYGMQTMNEALYQLYLQNEITRDIALQRSPESDELLRLIGERRTR